MLDVSVVIPYHNDSETLQRAIDSCVTQTFKNIEIIIIDNGSTPQETLVCSNLANAAGINYFYLEKGNRSKARNIGIRESKGKYIQFLDADDAIDKKKFQKSIMFLKNNPQYDAYVTGTKFKNKDGQTVGVYSENKFELLYHNTLELSSVIFRKKDSLVGFDENISRCEDWLFWIDNLSKKKVFFDTEYLANFKYITGNNTMKNIDEMLWANIYVLKKVQSKYRFVILSPLYQKYKIVSMMELIQSGSKDKLLVRAREEKSILLYYFSCFIFHIPVINRVLKNKLSTLSKDNLYTL